MNKKINNGYGKPASENPQNLGVLQWFHLGEYERVERTIKDLKALGFTKIRTGASWADYHREEGPDWYKWLMPKLSEHFEILPCFLYTPPSIGIEHKTSSPPKGPKRFADFLDEFVTNHGEHFEWVELWNEPNNRSEYDYTLDSNWDIFSEMIICAAHWAKKLGKKVALGGMSPIDINWLDYMAQKKVLENMDAVGIHGFPGTFDSHFKGWDEHIDDIYGVLSDHNLKPEIWITEAGFSTWRHDEKQQFHEFMKVINSKADRVYWYSLYDLQPSKPTVDGFHMDEREYFFGMKSYKNQPKLLYRMLESYTIEELKKIEWLKVKEPKPQKEDEKKYVMITGGSGFIGINLADYFLKKGKNILIYDNLSRTGVEKNLQWLLSEHDNSKIKVEIADVRNYHELKRAIDQAEMVYHLAAQVAVTTSLEDPSHDFEVNARGTFNLLEAIRNSKHQPPLIFTSTNKVYGNLSELEFSQNGTRYYPMDESVEENGINEEQVLDFHSPYGNSKGAAEQYVLDYARSYGLKASVFRMSCIYGPHQFGTEDQGWVAHFIINAIKQKPIKIYGNGKQVRDILFVDDLVRAFHKAWDNIDQIKGEAFNIGGGIDRTISLLELIEIIENKLESEIDLSFHETRTGDQVYYVSNTQKFRKLHGWDPSTLISEGINKLYKWLVKEHRPELAVKDLTNEVLNKQTS